MTKIITCSELRYRTLDELDALFQALQIEFEHAAPGCRAQHRAASLESVRRAMARHAQQAAEAGRWRLVCS